MGGCVGRQAQTDDVYRQLYDKVYEEVERATTLKQIESLKANKYLYLKSNIQRKGTIRKLFDHLESHKNRITTCVGYILAFGNNPLKPVSRKIMQTTTLIALDDFIQKIDCLTQDTHFVKKKQSPMDFLDMGLRRQQVSSKKYTQSQRKNMALQSDSLAKAYELSVVKLLKYFKDIDLDPDQSQCYFSCVGSFCKYEPFKFDKHTVATLFDLIMSTFSRKGITDEEGLSCLQIIESLLHKIHPETEGFILASVLRQVLNYQLEWSPDKYSETQLCIQNIIAIYESLLHESKYLKIYEVLLNIWDNNFERKQVIFKLAFNNIMLFVLVRMLTESDNKEYQLHTVDNMTSIYISSSNYPQLKAVSNRNTLFTVLMEYIRWGYETKKERLLLPIQELCLCLISNCAVNKVNNKAWLDELIQLMKDCQIDLGLLFKELLQTVEELRNRNSDTLVTSCLELLARLLSKELDMIEEHLDEDIYRVISSKAFRLSPKLKLSYCLLEVLFMIMSIQRFHSLSESYSYVTTVVAHDICRLLGQQYTPAYTEVMYACGIKICNIMDTLRKHKFNLFLAIVQRVIQVYSDPHINLWFKCGYYIMLKKCTEGLSVIQPDQHNQKVIKEIKFVFSVDSNETCSRMVEKMKQFHRQPISLELKEMQAYEQFDVKLFDRFNEILAMNSIQSETVATIESEEANRILIIKNRHSSRQASNSFSNDQSLQSVLNIFKKS